MNDKLLLGIDVGTTGTKALLFDLNGNVCATEYREYQVSIPAPGAAEQDPELWWHAVSDVVASFKKDLLVRVAAVGFSGQMHGLVLTDKAGKPVRPAMIWLDQRAKSSLAEIASKMSVEETGVIFHNRPAAGYAFPSLLWVRAKEPGIFEKAAHVMMPKDYIRFRMTGEIGTDASDCSSSCLADEKMRDWAWPVIDRFGFDHALFPEVHEAVEIAGHITKACAEETGLPEGLPVVYGSGDQPAQGIGNGQMHEGDAISNIGTGGQISTYFTKDVYDPKLRLQTFCHGVNRAYTVFGGTLSAGLSLKWTRDSLGLFPDYSAANAMASEVKPGCDGLTFLPYLNGERTPIMMPDAKGVFYGVQLAHDKRHFVRAVMEGVTFSLKDTLEIYKELEIPVSGIIASGGGANSPLWLQMQADIFGQPVRTSKVHEQACMGACIYAMIGSGLAKDTEEAVGRMIAFEDKIYEPDMRNSASYEEAYARYHRVVNANLELMKENV